MFNSFLSPTVVRHGASDYAHYIIVDFVFDTKVSFKKAMFTPTKEYHAAVSAAAAAAKHLAWSLG